jgi:hypothetical protein
VVSPNLKNTGGINIMDHKNLAQEEINAKCRALGISQKINIKDVEIFKKDQEKIRNQKRSIGKVVIK